MFTSVRLIDAATVTESADACAPPIVIRASGPFPYIVTVNTVGSTTQASDPAPVSSGAYNFSLCGLAASAEPQGSCSICGAVL